MRGQPPNEKLNGGQPPNPREELRPKRGKGVGVSIDALLNVFWCKIAVTIQMARTFAARSDPARLSRVEEFMPRGEMPIGVSPARFFENISKGGEVLNWWLPDGFSMRDPALFLPARALGRRG